MATSLQELLDLAIAAAAAANPEPEPSLDFPADAAAALRHIGRAVSRLAADGLTPDAGSYRERFATEFADACLRAAQGTAASGGRLALLCGAAADQSSLLRPELDNAARWAGVLAFAETARHITAASATDGDQASVRTLRRSCVLLERTGAIEPPARYDTRLLHRPVPWPAGIRPRHERLHQAHEALAALVHHSRPTMTLTLSEVLAVSIAAETACRHAESGLDSETGSPSAAAAAWRAVRTELQPFNDGSRHYRHERPPIIAAALALHDALRRSPPPVTASQLGDVSAATLPAATGALLPVLAEHLCHQVNRWASSGALHAYAIDLRSREDRVEQQLAGHRANGLIRADGLDLAPATRALRGAQILSRPASSGAFNPPLPSRKEGDPAPADRLARLVRQHATQWPSATDRAVPTPPRQSSPPSTPSKGRPR